MAQAPQGPSQPPVPRYWKVADFGGEIPKMNARLLPTSQATQAVNVDLHDGGLSGLPQPLLTVDLTGKAPWPIRKAYRCPSPTPGGPDAWLPLPSEWSSVTRSPLANDTEHRYYWTNPPGQPAAGVWWSTYADILAGNPPWNLGFVAPDPTSALSVTNDGTGDTTVPEIERVYLYTFIDANGLESSPNGPSAVVAGYPGSTWTITGFPTSSPPSPPGLNYIPADHIRLYRTITGSSSGANFYVVADLPFGTTTYADSSDDTSIVGNNTLQTASFAPPLPNMDGLVSYPGGMLIGFTDNTIHFCQPDMPHAWPAGYDVSVTYQIMGLAVWQQALVVLTQGYPSQGTGTTPDSFVFSQIGVPEPCIARGSIIVDLYGVYYASQNGLVMLNYFGMQNQTLSNLTKNIWLTEYKAANIVACRHRSQYLAINGTGMGFIIDYAEQRLGIIHITPVINCVSVWNDVYTGTTFMVADEKVWEWDSPVTPPLPYRWRSKEFYMPAPISLGACQISLVASRQPYNDTPPPNPGPPPPLLPSGLEIPPGVAGIFRLYFGTNGANLAHEQYLDSARSIFRLPSGRKAFNWQFEIVGNVEVLSVELATTMKELRRV